jgi:RimJ/RimL family protein N-acetyltransferase
MEIKPISSSDIESLSRIFFAEKNEYIKYFLPFKSKEELKKLILQARKDKFFLIIHEKDTVGYVSLRGLDDGYKNPRFGIFISEKYSGKGYGYSASKEIIKIAVDSGSYEYIDLKVDPKNYKAIKLYEKLGFEFYCLEGQENVMILHI